MAKIEFTTFPFAFFFFFLIITFVSVLNITNSGESIRMKDLLVTSEVQPYPAHTQHVTAVSDHMIGRVGGEGQDQSYFVCRAACMRAACEYLTLTLHRVNTLHGSV